MTEQNDLQRRFDNLKASLTEQWADQGITTPPTDAEVWGQMRAVATQNMEEALADDMEGYVIMYQKRIKLIDAQLEAIDINQQAEQHKAINLYEQGLRHY
jgi:hypothetical protein